MNIPVMMPTLNRPNVINNSVNAAHIGVHEHLSSGEIIFGICLIAVLAIVDIILFYILTKI